MTDDKIPEGIDHQPVDIKRFLENNKSAEDRTLDAVLRIERMIAGWIDGQNSAKAAPPSYKGKR